MHSDIWKPSFQSSNSIVYFFYHLLSVLFLYFPSSLIFLSYCLVLHLCLHLHHLHHPHFCHILIKRNNEKTVSVEEMTASNKTPVLTMQHLKYFKSLLYCYRNALNMLVRPKWYKNMHYWIYKQHFLSKRKLHKANIKYFLELYFHFCLSQSSKENYVLSSQVIESKKME